MRTVHKFPIEPTGDAGWFDLEVPADAKLVLASAQMGRGYVWLELDTDAPKVRRLFQIRGTGQAIADGATHVVSFTTNNGAFVWHVYEARQ